MTRASGDAGTARWLFTAALVVSLLIVIPQAAHAQSFWRGALSDQWGSPLNWTPNGVPSGGTVTFGLPNNTTVDLGGAARTVELLQFNSSAPFTLVNDVLSIESGVSTAGDTGGARHEIASNVAIGGPGLWTVGSAAPLEVSGLIAGGGSIEKQGAGQLFLSSSNFYTGGTTLSAGTLAIGNDDALGTGTLTIGHGTTLDAAGGDRTVANDVTVAGDFEFDASNRLTLTGLVDLGASDRRIARNGSVSLGFDGVLSGSGGLTVARTTGSFGFTRLGGSQANTYTGTTTVESEFLALSKDAGVTAIPGDLVIQSDAVVSVFADEQIADSATVTLDGTLDLVADETLGNLQGSGTIVNSAGGANTLTLQAGNYSGSISEGILATSTLTLRKATAGTLVLSGNNSHRGGTQILGGTLSISANNNLGTGGGRITLNGGALLATESLTTSRPTTLGSNGTLSVAPGRTLTHNGVISGTGSLITQGAGTLVLGGSNTYSGNTAVRSRLMINNNAALGTGIVSTQNNGSLAYGDGVAVANDLLLGVPTPTPLEVAAGNSAEHSGVIFDQGAGFGITKVGAGTLVLSGNNTYRGGTEVGDGTLSISADSNLGDASGSLTLNGGALHATESLTTSRPTTLALNSRNTLRVDSGRNLTHNGVISGNGLLLSLGNAGGGTIEFGGSEANTYSGATIVRGGLLTLEKNPGVTAIPSVLEIESGATVAVLTNEQITDSAAVIVDGDLALRADQTLGLLRGSGTVFSLGGSPTLTLRAGLFTGSITGPSVTLRKTARGTLVLAGNNDYTGGTEIAGGVLQISADSNLGRSDGGLTLNGGILRITESLITSRTTSLASSGALDVDSGRTLTHDGVIRGSGSLEKVGAGTLTLNGSNTYSGDTVIDAGVLSLTQAFLADTADVLLDETATLDLTHAATDTIDELILGGFSRAVGTHGAIGSGADFEWSQITGTGLLLVTTFNGLAGDYNNDGIVNAADYAVWRSNLNAPAGTLVNDTDGGVIGQAQFETWVANFGQTLASPAVTVPEPLGIGLLMAGLLTGAGVSRRSRPA